MSAIHSIMLVDDDSTTNFINQLLINRMHITDEIIVANNGKEALEIISSHCIDQGYCPDLILLDINMPVMNGFGFLEAYQNIDFANKDSTIIVMLTTSLNPKDTAMAEHYNVAGYISKPLIEGELRKLLTEHFDQRQQAK